MTAGRRLAVTAFALFLAVPFAAACSEETKDSAKQTADALEERADQGAFPDAGRAGDDEDLCQAARDASGAAC